MRGTKIKIKIFFGLHLLLCTNFFKWHTYILHEKASESESRVQTPIFFLKYKELITLIALVVKIPNISKLFLLKLTNIVLILVKLFCLSNITCNAFKINDKVRLMPDEQCFYIFNKQVFQKHSGFKLCFDLCCSGCEI